MARRVYGNTGAVRLCIRVATQLWIMCCMVLLLGRITSAAPCTVVAGTQMDARPLTLLPPSMWRLGWWVVWVLMPCTAWMRTW